MAGTIIMAGTNIMAGTITAVAVAGAGAITPAIAAAGAGKTGLSLAFHAFWDAAGRFSPAAPLLLGSGVAQGGAFAYKPRLLAAAVARGPFDKGCAHCARSLRSEAVTGARPDLFRSQDKGTDMALYEHLLIARQDISAQQVDALATHLKTIVEGEGGKVEKQEYWGLRGLAYRIKKNRKGHYVLLNINAPSKAVVELERQLKINEDVLRYITVSVDQFEVSASKARRDDRPEGERKPEGVEGETAI